MTQEGVWHGDHEIPVDRMMTASIGPLLLAVSHRPGEWRIGWTEDESRSTAPAEIRPHGPVTDPEAEMEVHRFLTRRTGDRIVLRPSLADRPVVTRPEMPVRVPAGDEVQIFVSTPVWVRVELPSPQRSLVEIPTSRPSDTWFGSNTRHGAVAYGIRTTARIHLENLPRLSHRAITRVTVRNRASSVLALERLSVPAPDLRIYEDGDGGLWTSPLVATREDEGSPAEVEIQEHPPEEAQGAREIAPPREESGRNVLSRVLHVLAG